MRKMISKLLVSFIQVLHRFERKLMKGREERKYKALGPCIIKEEDCSYYSEIILDVLKNKDVTNIAMTGTYGSGKSSILKSFRESHKEYSCLNISLASFGGRWESGKKLEHENLIEASILQQIFYHVKDSSIPDSRFKRIIKQTKGGLFFKAVLIFGWLFSGAALFKIKFLSKVSYWDNFFSKYPLIMDLSLSALFIMGGVLIISHILRLFNNTKLSKLNLKNGEIEISKDANSSVLNKHLDELLYFFEVTKFDVVILEDLDRFDNSEIFTKLRELNILINNSKQIKRKVTFIYAIRDDMFKDEHRTKFFDFIIPVIPVINASNSEEIILQELERHNLRDGLSKEFISDVSLYISDMRMLINIVNEFDMYRRKLGAIELNNDKLFAMIIYKNCYPDDFALLHSNEGGVYKILTARVSLIEKLNRETEAEISRVEEEIEYLTQSISNKIKELRAIYILRLSSKLHNVAKLLLNNTQYNLAGLCEDIPFEALLNQAMIQYPVNYGWQQANISFREIEKEVNSEKSYREREELLKKGVEPLRNELEQLETEKKYVEHYSLQEIIEVIGDDEVFDNEMREKRLLVYLLRNGYIDEMYHSYISHFYEGRLTKSDMDFVMAVKDNRRLPFDYRLDRADVVVEKLRLKELKKSVVLNCSLLDLLIEKQTDYKEQLELLLEQIIFENIKPMDFIDTYLKIGKHIDYFIRELCKSWDGLWEYVVKESNYSREHKELYLKKIITHLDIVEIVQQNKSGLLTEYISNKTDFLTHFKEEKYLKKVKDILMELNIEFRYIENSGQTPELFTFVYENDRYQINEQMIELVIECFNTENSCRVEDLQKANYSTILKSSCKALVEYIDRNIIWYIDNVFLTIESNCEESQDSVLELLTNEQITIEKRVAILDKVNIVLDNIKSVDEKKLWPHILSNMKVDINWYNIVSYFDTLGVLDDRLAEILNAEQNYNKLSKEKIDKDNKSIIERVIGLLNWNKINSISKAGVLALTKSIPEKSVDLATGYLSESELREVLINEILEKDRLEPSPDNFDILKRYNKKWHISLLELNREMIIDNIESDKFDADDIIELLTSTKLTDEEKLKIITMIDEKLLTDNSQLSNEIGKIVLENNMETLEAALFFQIVENASDDSTRIKLLNKKIDELDDEQITGLLTIIGGEYLHLAKPNEIFLVESSEHNKALLKELKERKLIVSYRGQKKGISVQTRGE